MSLPRLFISYSHKDTKWVEQLLVHLRPLKQQNKVAFWTDQEIRPGANWLTEIESALQASDIAILLVTPAFIDSGFIHNVELPELMKKRVIWVAVESSLYKHTPIDKLHCANNPSRTLDGLPKAARNRAWVNICEQILRAAEDLPDTSNNATAAASGSAITEILLPAPRSDQQTIDLPTDSLTHQESTDSGSNKREPAEDSAQTIAVATAPVLRNKRSNPLDGSEMVWIPEGTFQMGGDKYSREQPVHKVSLAGFWMQRTAVTVGQYEAFVSAMRDAGKQISGHAADMPADPHFNASWRNKDHPMVNISWGDAEAYCKWAQVRLPTEAEWEYASRGGLDGKEYPLGDDWDGSKCVNSVGENNPGGTERVGMYPANGYSLYDMSGNVWEWCADWFDVAYYQSSPSDNPKGPQRGDGRVVRGGSWYDYVQSYFRCAYRGTSHPVARGDDLGFRCCASGL